MLIRAETVLQTLLIKAPSTVTKNYAVLEYAPLHVDHYRIGQILELFLEQL